MTPVDINKALKSLTLLVDSREKQTIRFHRRMQAAGIPYERVALSFGDYSGKCALEDGSILDLSDSVAIERKMNIDELCSCFCQNRSRFEREFLRAKKAGAKLYLLVECATWEKVLQGDYSSKMSPQALLASLTAWLARYNCQLLFCDPKSTGRIIKEVIYREIKERLEAM